MTTRSRIESESQVHVLCGKLQAQLIVMTMMMVMMMMMVVMMMMMMMVVMMMMMVMMVMMVVVVMMMMMMMMMRFSLWSTPSSYTKTMQLMHTGAVSLPNDAYLYPMS